MSAVEASKPLDLPQAGSVEAAPAPVLASDNLTAPVEVPQTEELPKTESEAVAPVEEKKEDKVEDKVIEPIHTGALGYKAPGLKNAFRFSKKYFWFGEEPVPSSNLSQYLRGEKPEVAHPVVAWSSQTGKGLLFFVKHADQKEHPAGVLNLAYATDLLKDGTIAFAFKISGHKHTFEAQTAPERDGWFVAVEKAIADAKEAKEGIESSEGYKEQKEKIGKPTPLAAATASAPKKSIDATPKLAESEAPATEGPVVVAPARAGSSSSSSSDEDKKAKNAKSKSRSVSRKRASIFGGLLGKKDKEHKDESEAVKAEPGLKKEEPTTAPQLAETSTTAPIITEDIPNASEELKTEATPAPVVAAPAEEIKTEETPAKVAEDKPKPTKRGSIFGSFVEKLKSPREEKKEHDLIPAPAKEADPVPEASKPLEEAQVVAPVTPVVDETTATEPLAPKTEESKSATTGATGTPSKEKEHFSFGKLFGGNKERAKSPAATEKAPAPESTVDAAPKLEDTPAAAPAVTEPVLPVTESKPEAVEEKKEETPKKEKRASFFGSLTRSLSKATTKKDVKQHDQPKETPATVPETSEEAPVIADTKTETPALDAPAEKTIGDVPAEAVTIGEPKSNPTVATTA